jgi:hypothetical protein
MSRPIVTARGVGKEGQPLVTIDGFSPCPDELRAAASAASFGTAGQHYPGIRAALPADYMRDQLPLITRALREIFGRYGPVNVIDASFSIVTTPPDALSVQQRLPHCDAFTADRVALVHYLSPHDDAGTAFFRHRSTGFETITESRKAVYFDRLDAEMREGGLPPASYIVDDTPLFERTAIAEAVYNRALLYPSFLLHSGAIPRDAGLAPDPAAGRLTVTGFFSAG